MRNWRSLLAALMLACSVGVAGAEDGWNFTVGAGAYRSSVYTGSDDYYYAPFPLVAASYARGEAEISLSLLDGLGLHYRHPESGLLASLALTYGEERDSEEYSILGIDVDHSDRTRRLLAGSPTVTTPVRAKALLGWATAAGTLGAAISYHPTTVDDDLTGKTDFPGFLYTLTYSLDVAVTASFSVSALVGVEYMDGEYADAWYSVRRPTAALELFEADAGLRDAMASIRMTRMFSSRVGVAAVATGTQLLGDAKQSPYTVDSFQPMVMIFTFYSF